MSAGGADGPQEGTPEAAEGETPAVAPFWQRMPLLFLFPLQRPALLRILGASLAAGVLGAVCFADVAGAPARTVMLLFGIFCAAALFIAQFSFRVIENTAAGYLDSRNYPPTQDATDLSRPVKMFLVLIFMPLVLNAIGALLPALIGKALLVAWALLLPASVMVMTRTGSFAEAVNPANCLQTALAIGAPYLLLCLYLVLLDFGLREVLEVVMRGAGMMVHGAPAAKAAGAQPQATAVSPAGFAVFFFLLLAVAYYFEVLTCALIGYTMYQYSGALGVAVVGPGEVRAGRSPLSAAAHARRQREALLGRMLAAGEIREALELLSNELRERPNDLSLHVRLHALLIHEGSRPKIESHALQYLDLLMDAGNWPDALALFEKTRAMFPEFMPREPARWPELARAALGADKPELAAVLVRGFDRKFPAHPGIPEAYVVGARLLLQGGQPDQARKLLRHVVTAFPTAPAAEEAKRYLARFAPASAPAGPPPGPAAPGR